MGLARVAFACAALLLLGSAQAQVLYKWTDAEGKVQYSDKPPKNFTGVVTRIEPDVQPSPTPMPKPAPASAAPKVEGAKAGGEPVADLATRRRALREKLSANVEAARARVEAARKALDDAKEAPQDDERQVIQQRVAGTKNRGTPQNYPNQDATQSRATGGGMHGMSARSNCREAKGEDGKSVTICPSSLLKPEYFERVERLEEALRKAEQDLELAQETYRRNVD